MYLLQVEATDEPSDQLTGGADQLTGSTDQLTGGTDQLTGSTEGRRTKPALVYISFEDNAIRLGRVLLHFIIRYEKTTVCYSKVNR
jgi:X-X-X-Leu-X-X-Gly heptad repeat protein